MKKFFAALLSAALLLSLPACGETSGPAVSGSASTADTSQAEQPPRELKPFTLAIYPERSLHPALAGSRANLTLAPLLYESLFTVDASFQAQPALCRSFAVSEDKLVWTFTLQPGATFSDGTPLTGQAVADALDLARSSGSRYQARLSDVAAVTASEEDPDQFVIALRRPNGSLPLLLDIPIALGDGSRPAGTGPYVLAEDGASLIAREDRKDKALSSIPLRAVAESDELIYAFDAGEVSLVDVDLTASNAMGYGGNYQTWDYPTTDLLYLAFNAQKGVFRSAEARRAVCLAVDRDTVASTVYANHAISALHPVHPGSPLEQPTADPPVYDPEGLAEQVSRLRLSGSRLVFLVNSENVAKVSTAQLIAYQLEAAGFSVELKQLPFEDYAAALAWGEFDLYLGETVLTADFDLAPLLSSAGALNYGGWTDETADGLLSGMRSASPEEKRVLAGTFFALLDEQAPIVPILFKNGSVLTQWGQLSGLSPVRGNVFYQIENWNVT